jgi:methionine-rich copper-binding protein CopC
VKLALAAPTLATIVALTIAQGGAGLAHANYFRSVPAPNERLGTAPQRVLIAFSEAPDPKQSGIEVLSPDGRTVASGGEATADATELALALPSLPASTYVVAWKTVSAVDGDAAHGYFGFAVGADRPASGSLVQGADAAGTHATLAVTPGRVGANDYRVRVSDAGGGPLANVTRVRILFTDLDRDIGTSVVVLAASGTDYGATGMELGLAGRFSAQLEVRRKDILDDLVYKMTFAVSPATVASASPSASAAATAASSTTPAPVSSDGPAPQLGWAIAAAAIVIATGVWVVRRR